MQETTSNDDTNCCPKFGPKPWDEKEFEWKDKKFIKESAKTFMFMPLNFGGVMKRLNQQVEQANAKVPDWLCLSYHKNKWNMDLYLAVDKKVGGVDNTTLSGKFISKVYEGSYKDAGKWNKDFAVYANNKGYHLKKTYMWYTTCPKCAKKYGKNHTVIIGQIS